MFGEDAVWTMDRHLAALTVDQLAVANWQRSGGKKRDYPKPIERPGVRSRRTSRVGDASRLTPTEVRALLDARKPAP
jgi:hypothetical protein